MGSAGRAVKKVTKKVVAAPFKLAGEVAGAVDKDLEGRIQRTGNAAGEIVGGSLAGAATLNPSLAGEGFVNAGVSVGQELGLLEGEQAAPVEETPMDLNNESEQRKKRARTTTNATTPLGILDDEENKLGGRRRLLGA